MTATVAAVQARGSRSRKGAERAFHAIVAAAASLVLVLLVAVGVFLVARGWDAIRHYGLLSFLRSTSWAPSHASVHIRRPNPYGVLQFVYGTLVTSFVGLLLAVPVALGVALFLAEVAPARVRGTLVSVTELLAAVPSVVYGFWGVFALIPTLRPAVNLLQRTIGPVPVVGVLFRGTFYGVSYLTAAIILSIMILPIITAVSREVIATTPEGLRQAAYGVGATRWETVRAVVLPHARSGLVGAAFLGLGRALGETIAVTMVIGNDVSGIPRSLLAPGATMASVIANEFTEANRPFHLAALFVVAVLLLAVSLVVNVGARTIVGSAARRAAR